MLRSIESKLESLFEGVFGRAFRTNVQPVELARKLVKEMDDHRNVSVSRVYVPNEYTIYLSPGDREQFAELRGLAAATSSRDYLAEHARRESYALLTPPRVLARDRRRPRRRRVRDRDADGRSRPGGRARPPTDAEAGATMIYKPPRRRCAADRGRLAVELGVQREVAVLDVGRAAARARRSERVVLGRSKDADVQVADPNVSRRHAELRQEGATYWLVDLDSTNGVEVRRQAREAAQARGRRRASRSARPSSRSRGSSQ